MTSDKLQEQENLGRKIAAALAPLGLKRAEIQDAAATIVGDGGIRVMMPASKCRERQARAQTTWRRQAFSCMAGVAAYFEEQGK